MSLLLALWLSSAAAENLTVTVPAGCTAAPATVAVTCGTTPPPAVCPPGMQGSPPNCVPIPPGNIVCAGFPSTLVTTLPWTSPQSSVTTGSIGGLPGNGALVVKFTTPAAPNPPPSRPSPGQIVMTEYQGPPTQRRGSLSLSPCDFTGGINGQGVFTNSVGVNLYYAWSGTQYINILPNTTYYFNMATNSCSPGPDCDVKVTLQLPR